MTWHAQLALVLALGGRLAASSSSCRGFSDDCSSNPSQEPMRQFSADNFQASTCNLKWDRHCTVLKDGKLQQKPPAYPLCNSGDQPAGRLPVDAYTLSLQKNDFSANGADWTLHGLWPGNQHGQGAKNQPYGCQNGEEFNETILATFQDLLNYFWPTDPQFNNTVECFILSEWMKHGTCAVVPGRDRTAFRLPQEAYFRTGFVLANEFNQNEQLQQLLQKPLQKSTMEPLISTDCVQCAYKATVGWKDTTVDSVPRMSDCVNQCFACGNLWDRCSPANLDSTVQLDPSNAPESSSYSNNDSSSSSSSSSDSNDESSSGDSNEDEDASASFPQLTEESAMQRAFRGSSNENHASPFSWEEGTWRSFGTEQLGSGKFEFAQTFIDDVLTITTDSPYASKCTYAQRGDHPGKMVLRCGGDQPHVKECLVQRLPDIGGLETAFLACNHTGEPAPASFYTAMDTKGCGNFLMFRCKASATGCTFHPVTATDIKTAPVKHNSETATTKKKFVSHSQPGIAGAPRQLLGSWRSLQVSSEYQEGLARWNFTADGQASLQWPNHADRGVKRYSVSHAAEDPTLVRLASASGTIATCRFEFQYQSVYSYAVLNCGAPNDQPAADKKTNTLHNTQWVMGRCNPCDSHCSYSCTAANDYCGAGSCDPADAKTPAGALPSPSPLHKTHAATPDDDAAAHHDWCTPDDATCWPTKTAIDQLELALDPTVPRLGLRWSSYPQAQPAPVPTGSDHNQPLYGLGNSPGGVRALYSYYDDIAAMQQPCFTAAGTATAWNVASDVCKAAAHNNEYRNWNPFIVVFPLNERHVTAALIFAAQHRLCIATAGTGHEYNSRNSCPTGGLLIRTILLKDKAFLPTWKADPALAPAGAFRFGAGSLFTEMHKFSGKHQRVVASGWCSTVGMVGYHLGGGHGPFAPSMGLGVDNVLEIEVLQVGRDDRGQPVVHKKIASRHRHPQLFWAMRGGGGGVWGVVLSMTLRAHPIPEGGLSRVYMTQTGTFCPGKDAPGRGYEWVRAMWPRFTAWQLSLNQKVSTQPGFFINTSNYYQKGDLCSVTWSFTFEYFYAGGQKEPDYIRFRDGLKDVLQTQRVTETNFNTAYEYLLSMPPDKFPINTQNPLPAPHPPSDAATGSQNSVLVSREALESQFASTMMDVLDICVASLRTPDPTSPAPNGTRCGFHYLYTSLTGNLGSAQPADTAISPGLRSAVMLWNARTLTTQQSLDTVYKLGPNSYFSESAYVMHDWTARYWTPKTYEMLLAVKKAHDPGNLFWCHHCVGDDPNDAYGDPLRVAPTDDSMYGSPRASAAAEAGAVPKQQHDEL